MNLLAWIYLAGQLSTVLYFTAKAIWEWYSYHIWGCWPHCFSRVMLVAPIWPIVLVIFLSINLTDALRKVHGERMEEPPLP